MVSPELTNAQNFLNQISDKGSYLRSTTDDKDLGYEEALDLIMAHQVNVFEERCYRNKTRIATWMYDRVTGKGTITSPHTSKKAKQARVK